MTDPAQLAAWIEWRERCAADLCSDDARARLESWARGHAQREWSGTLGEQLAEAWHIFETHMVVPGVRSGKAGKSVMFEVAAEQADDVASLGVIQDYARKALLSALRSYACGEIWGHRQTGGKFAKIPMQSLDVPNAPSLEETLARHDYALSPEEAADRAEMENIAISEAGICFDVMPRREQVALGAVFADRSLSDPAALALAECGKSQLHEAKAAASRRIVEAIRAKYGTESGLDRVQELSGMVIGRIGHRCAAQFFPEIETLGDS